jgi:pilus assembly protein CpaC
MKKPMTEKKYQGDSSSGSSDNDGGLGDDKANTEILTKRVYKGVENKITISFPQQVNVKVKIVEVSTSIINKLGVKWSGLLGGEAGNSGEFRIENGFSLDDISALVSAMNQDNAGQILAQPNLSVKSGKQASILVGGEIPIIQQGSDSFNVDYKEFGVKLDLTANIQSPEEIEISIATGVSGIDNSLKRGDIPGFKTRKASSIVQVKNGGSFILGGLISTEDKETLEKIPFIGDVPILGALFRHTNTERTKTELVVIVTVNLVKDVSSQDIVLPSIQKTSDFSRWIGVDLDSKSRNNKGLEVLLADGGFEL